jgi:hypothetical protein
MNSLQLRRLNEIFASLSHFSNVLALATLPAPAANDRSTNGTTSLDPSEISSSNLTQ